MKILFLNCNKRTKRFLASLEKWVKRHHVDIVILAEACYFDCVFDAYPYTFVVEDKSYRNALKVFAKYPFNIEEINYTVDNDIVKQKFAENMQRYRLLNLDFHDFRMTAVYVTAGWYNYLAMRALEDNLPFFKPDLILGDFNSGYVDDDLHAPSSLIFMNGFLFFNRFEKMGYVDRQKGLGLYSYKSKVRDNAFRIDHCFMKADKNYKVSYVLEFLEKNISDHAGVLVEL